VLCYLSCLSSSVSCVWLCPTHIVLCYLSCLSSSCVLCMVVSNTYSVVLFVLLVVLLCVGHNHTQDTGRRQTRQITQHYMCWTQPYTRHRRRQTRQIIQHYMCWTQRLCPTYIVLCYLSCLSSSVSCVWLCPTHIVLCYLSCLSSSVSCVWLCPTHILLCYLSCLSSSVSCLWLCPTHIVLCYLSCLSSSCVLCMAVSNDK
jgi:hypothetical protein